MKKDEIVTRLGRVGMDCAYENGKNKSVNSKRSSGRCT